MTRYQNTFIRSALEELDAEVAAGTAGGVTEVDVDNSTDAVAELMEKNATLESSNTELEEESFDNDVSAIAGASDSTHADLDEAVNAGAALEELAMLCDLTVRGKLTNKATVASHAMMLNHITTGLKIPNQMAALEALALPNGASEPASSEQQTKSIGSKAADMAKSIGKKLVEGIKRIVGWLINVLRNLMASSKKIEDRAEAAMKLIETIDVSKKITAGPFIASLRLVEGGGDANDQFAEYFKLADVALNGFFNESFAKHMLAANFKVEGTEDGVRTALSKVVQSANDTMFTEHGDASDVSTEIPEGISDQELSVSLTKPCIGGLQLFLASTHSDSKKFYCRSGVAKKELKFASPSEIPVAEKATARMCLKSAVKLLKTHKELEDNLDDIVRRSENHWHVGPGSSALMGDYLSTLAAFATSVAPQLLRLNMKNSAALVAYIEKSITVSKPDSKAKDDKEAK